jgi:hypothetical protein
MCEGLVGGEVDRFDLILRKSNSKGKQNKREGKLREKALNQRSARPNDPNTSPTHARENCALGGAGHRPFTLARTPRSRVRWKASQPSLRKDVTIERKVQKRR